MRLFELNNNFKSKPIVYVDMDGVLADFFGTVADHHGVDNWREARKKYKKIDQVAKKKGFFKNLKPLPHSKDLIMGVAKLAQVYSILSSPLKSEVEQSSREKSEWLQHHLQHKPPTSIIFDHEKFKFAKQADGTPNILIDDYDTNIRLWEANGGIGILYKDEECDRVLQQLHKALHGKFKRTYDLPLAVLQKEKEQTNESEDEESVERKDDPKIDLKKKLWTNKEVLKYVAGIHHDYRLEKPILAHKTWQLAMVETAMLSTPEKGDQDDPYRRLIDLDWDHISQITREEIMNRPIVADENGWILDGNHRVTAARAAQIGKVPALVPYKSEQKISHKKPSKDDKVKPGPHSDPDAVATHNILHHSK